MLLLLGDVTILQSSCAKADLHVPTCTSVNVYFSVCVCACVSGLLAGVVSNYFHNMASLCWPLPFPANSVIHLSLSLSLYRSLCLSLSLSLSLANEFWNVIDLMDLVGFEGDLTTLVVAACLTMATTHTTDSYYSNNHNKEIHIIMYVYYLCYVTSP